VGTDVRGHGVVDSLEPYESESRAPAASEDTAKAREASGVHNANTRVTIAWPFSQIKLQEASAELTDLAGLVGELIEALSDVVPEDRLAPLRERAEALRARLR
jgi:hypothetical protein